VPRRRKSGNAATAIKGVNATQQKKLGREIGGFAEGVGASVQNVRHLAVALAKHFHPPPFGTSAAHIPDFAKSGRKAPRVGSSPHVAYTIQKGNNPQWQEHQPVRVLRSMAAANFSLIYRRSRNFVAWGHV